MYKAERVEQPKKMTYRTMKCQKFISHCISYLGEISVVDISILYLVEVSQTL